MTRITVPQSATACGVFKDSWPEDKDKDKDLRSEDKDLSVYANWTTAATLFVIKK